MKVDILVMRHPHSGAAKFLSEKTNTVIINAGDGTHEHPTQALLDCYSNKEKLGEVEGKKVVLIGDIKHSRVALSNIFAFQKLGAKVMVCGPTTLNSKIHKSIRSKVETDLKRALQWCDVANMLRIQLERQEFKYFPSLREYTMQFGLDMNLLNQIDKPITIMHPGPINRGVEISSEVADSSNAIILNQVENGVAIRMAVIYLLAGYNYWP
jgi:aspartate carbamoyltransferase catalytic subunit